MYCLFVHITRLSVTRFSIGQKHIMCTSLLFDRSLAGTIIWYGHGQYRTVVPAAKNSMKSIEFCVISQLHVWVSVNFHMQVSATNCHSKFEFHQVMTECCSKIEVYDWVLFQNWGLWLSGCAKIEVYDWVLFQNWGLWLSGCSKIEVYDWVLFQNWGLWLSGCS